MTIDEKISFKSNLKFFCISLIEQRILSSRQAMIRAQQAANSEEKSSAGEKYETSRAMNQRDRDMFARQLDANQQELALTALIDCNKVNKTAEPGSVIISKNNCFFIFAGLGKTNFEGKEVFIISPGAPLSKQLFKKKCGDSFLFNKETVQIKEIF